MMVQAEQTVQTELQDSFAKFSELISIEANRHIVRSNAMKLAKNQQAVAALKLLETLQVQLVERLETER